ncbi:MAG: hypothetical protein FD168_2061 [Desulfobulbaceae bacterium]|nr:MAG: hypothetical protein FD168_2061 [Desulfobulbaceae bacterium]
MYAICPGLSIFVEEQPLLEQRLWVPDGLNLLVVKLEELRRNLALPVTGESGDKPEEKKDADDKARQQEGWGLLFCRQGELQALLLRTDGKAFQAADTFGVAYGLPGSDLDGAGTDGLTLFAVDAQALVTSDLKWTEEG